MSNLYVFDSPFTATKADFDVPTALGGQAFVEQAQVGSTDSSGFAPGNVVRGFVAQASRGEVDVTGYQGGAQIGNGLVAQTGSTGVAGFFAGTQAKRYGLHDGASDADGDPISFEIVTPPSRGTLQIEFNGAFLYVPNRGASGIDSFTWRPWAAGEPGNTVTVTISVEQVLQVVTGEVDVVGFPATRAGAGLNAPASLGEVGVSGFASTGLVAGFVGQALLGEVDVTGFVGSLQGALQAVTGETSVTGFAGVTVAGWINRATQGSPVDVSSFAPTLSRGWILPASLGSADTTGFAGRLDTAHGFAGQALLGETDSTGFGGNLLSDLVAQTGFSNVVGFPGVLNNTPPDFEWSAEPPPTVYYRPDNHLPAGRVLDQPTFDALYAYWYSVGRPLTNDEMYAICGPPLPVPSIKRDFGSAKTPSRAA